MDFIVGTTNKAKVEAVERVLALHFPNSVLKTASVESGISNQPFGDEETLQGALNRALNANAIEKNSIGIGLEGGVRLLGDEFLMCNWGAFLLPDGRKIIAGGAQIPLPREIGEQIQNGLELGPVIDQYFGLKENRQSLGAIGIFTNGVIDRTELFVHILELLIGQYKYSLQSS